MTISSELTALQQDITNARTQITTMGGTVTPSGGSSQLATDIATIPSGGCIQDVSTSAEMDANLIIANVGKMYHYTGTSTSKYINGRYYLVKAINPISIELSVEGKTYGFENSSVLELDPDIYSGPYQSTNYHIHSTESYAKIKVKGTTNLTVWINSYAQNYSDYTMITIVDPDSLPTAYSEPNVKQDTHSFSKNPSLGLNTTYWKKVDYTTADGLTTDETEHTIYIIYRKSVSTSSYNDRGYFVVEKQDNIAFYEEYLSPKGNLTITDTTQQDVTTYRTAQVVEENLLPNNIKKDVNILGVVGTYSGAGGAGYKLSYSYKYTNSANCSLTLNEVFVTSPLSNHQDSNPTTTYINMPSIEKLMVNGEYRSDCIIEYTIDGTTRSLNYGEEVTLTGDASLYIYENSCLTGDTTILMDDKTEKSIRQLKIGDKVISYNPQTMEIEEDEVIACDTDQKKVHTEYDLWEFENDYKIRTVHRHRFYNVERQAMVYMDEWNIGEHTITKDGEQVALLKHTNLQCEVRHFTLFTKNQNYFANGMLSGNRETQELHLGTDEQKKIQSNPSEINESESIND